MVGGEGDAGAGEGDALAFKKAALQAGERFTHRDAAAGGEDAMPGNRLPARAGGHGMTRGASSAAEADGARKLAVGDNASFGDALDESVNVAPAVRHANNDSGNGDELPVLPL